MSCAYRPMQVSWHIRAVANVVEQISEYYYIFRAAKVEPGMSGVSHHSSGPPHESLDSDRFCEVAGLVHIGAALQGRVVGEQLHRYGMNDGG